MKKVLAAFLCVIFSAVIIFALLQFYPTVLAHELEFLANCNTKQVLNGSLTIEEASFDRHLILHIKHLNLLLKTNHEMVPIRISQIESENPIFYLLTGKSLTFRFEGVTTQSSKRIGINGKFHFELGKNNPYEIVAEVKEIGLDEIAWMNRDHLNGAAGNVNGRILIRGTKRQVDVFQMEIQTDSNGGFLQARVFDAFLAYVPQLANREVIRELVRKGGLIPFKNGHLNAELIGTDKLKVLLRMLILEYNLDLNLNIEIRTDAEGGLVKLAELFGIFQVKTK